MDPKKSYKVIVFIDGNNFYYKMKDMTSMKTEVVKLLDFKYNDFSQNLIKGDTLIEIRYYVGSVKRQAGPDKQKSEKLYANQQKLIAKLQKQKVAVILGNLIQHPDKSFHKKVVYVGLSKGQSFGLTKASDNTILLREEDVLPFIPCMHKMNLQQQPFEQIRDGLKSIET